jgi:hypothetical protein
MIAMNKIVEYCLYALIGIGVLFVAAIVVPAVIKAFFWVLLQMMYYPAQGLAICVVAIVALYLIDKKTKK